MADVADESVVPAGGDRSLQDAHAGRPDEPAVAAGLPGARALHSAWSSAITRRRACRRRPQSLDAMTRDALVEFHKAHYVPDRAVLAVAGDITLAGAKAEGRRPRFGAWKKAGVDDCRAARAAPLSGAEHLAGRAARLGADQPASSARRASMRTDPDYVALTVGEPRPRRPIGRLFEHLREQKGYTYGAGSALRAPSRTAGRGRRRTDVRTEVTDPALTDLHRRDPPDARHAGAGEGAGRTSSARSSRGFARSLESPTAMLQQLHRQLLSTSCRRTTGTRTRADRGGDRRPTCSGWRRSTGLPTGCRSSRSAMPAKVEPTLKKLGAVQIYDADGKPIK